MSETVKELIKQLPCNGHFFEIFRQPAFLMTPLEETSTCPTPWVWYAPTFVNNHPNQSHAWMFRKFLRHGIAIAGVEVGESFGSPYGRRVYNGLYERLCTHHELSKTPVLLPQSRGGLMLYNWAAENAERVAGIAGIYTVCDLQSYPGLRRACDAYDMSEVQLEACLSAHNPVSRLDSLVDAGVPILHIHGDNDTVVPLEHNAGELVRRYRQLGGHIELLVVAGKGHEVVADFFECQSLVDFVVRHAN